MKIDIDELISEIRKNAKSDRENIEDVREKLVKTAEMDPIMMGAVAEQVARLSDSLSKINLQLVEIAKMKMKEDIIKSKSEDDDEDKEALFDQIGQGFEREEEEESN